MTKKPVAIWVKEPFSKVVELMKTYSIRHLPVVGDKNRLVGIITQRDLYRIASPRKTMDEDIIYDKVSLDRFILENVMTTEIAALHPDDTLGRLIDLMYRKKCGCIPVIDENNYLLGIITHMDILRALAKDVAASVPK